MQEATRLVILDAIRREGEAADRYEREADELLARACDLDNMAAQARARAVIHQQALEPVRFILNFDAAAWDAAISSRAESAHRRSAIFRG